MLAEKLFVIREILKFMEGSRELRVSEKHFLQGIAIFAVFACKVLASVIDNFVK